MMETPYVLIRQDAVERNIAKMAALAAENGVKLRPHVKTHKMPHLAELQLRAGACGITVAKVGEAEVMAEHGIRDLFIAYPIVVPSKIERAVRLARNVRLSVGVDSLEGAQALSREAEAQGVELPVRLEIETGLRRTGVEPESAVRLGLEIARLPGLRLDGIFTYKGAVYKGAATLDLKAAGKEEGELIVAVAGEMRRAGLAIEHVSVGSTPTAAYAAGVPGVTEIRPGTYIFNDAMQLRLGVCTQEECAAAVVVSVVSIPAPDRIVVDGGSKTFATDVQPNQPPLQLCGFGTIVGYPDAVLERMNEEHGVIRMSGPHSLSIGDTLSIIPNHICSTINLHDAVYMTDGRNFQRYDIAARGRVQ
jgi:D-serine deaminase-like pyridoxal phosphate-dependent protein